ncbi:MAG: CRISPR system precrRNA processing endoribonuclease RAMP protein Cas6 [Desulfobaccales bacterium]
MLFGEYQFHGVLESDAILHPYKGSTFRGVFGHALKEVVCALKRQECPTCLLRRQCIYTQVFESPPEAQPQGAPPPPHPFVIEPPLDSRTHLAAGAYFDFTLLLFGPATQYLPYFVYAFQEMGKKGIGRQVQGRRARFRLLTVSSPTAGRLYSQEDKTLLSGGAEPLHLDGSDPAAQSVGELTLALLTPLRLKFQNHLQAELPFHVLVRACLRRVSLLFTCFGEGEPRLDYKGLIHRAQEVQTLRSSLRWFDWRRYSQRQDQAMLMGGLVGSITYQGNLGEYLPLLRFAEKVHLGKATTFGLGKIRLE